VRKKEGKPGQSVGWSSILNSHLKESYLVLGERVVSLLFLKALSKREGSESEQKRGILQIL
jgi:hypothetical protein